MSRGTCQVGSRNHNAKLSEEMVRKIRRLHAERIPQIRLAERFQVTRFTIRHVLRRETWSHV